MNGSTLLLMAIGGGFFGTTLAGMILFLFARWYIAAVALPRMLEKAHRENKCPTCEKPMRHDDVAEAS